jgi:hypothetical protein
MRVSPRLLQEGWRIKSTRLTETFDWPHFIEQYGSRTVLLFGVEEKGDATHCLRPPRAGTASGLDRHRAGSGVH